MERRGCCYDGGVRARLFQFLIGGVLGAALDQIHVRFGVLYYPHPVFLDQDWWVVPLFGAATIAFLITATPFARALEGRTSRPSGLRIALQALTFVAAYFATGILKDHSAALAMFFLLSFALRMAWIPAGATIALFSILSAILGTGFEILLSSTGAFYYSAPDFLGVAFWLPGLYAHGAPLALSIARRTAR
jgi:hypothetical protein